MVFYDYPFRLPIATWVIMPACVVLMDSVAAMGVGAYDD
jgi:hypothetical protein